MQRKQNKKLVSFARELRKNQTKEERKLWYDFLRTYPVKFTRQKVLGKYIADFYCKSANLIIELDGSQHFQEENLKKDEERTTFLEAYGLRVLRIPNNAVAENFAGVCEMIDTEIKTEMQK